MAQKSLLLDHRGVPVVTGNLSKEIAAPVLGGVHSVWTETILSGLTPMGMAEILRQASQGYPDRFFALAEEMEERDMHYASVLGTRKRAITGIEPIVISASEDEHDEDIAAAVRDIVEQPMFADDYIADALDALGKGYSVVEIIWDKSGKTWSPSAFEWRDPRKFVIDRIDGRTLRLKEPGNLDGIDLPPFQFSVHQPKLKTGLPIRGGLARLAAWAFLFKSYTLKDWMAFIEVYGMPLRVGKFGRGASLDDKRVLLQAVRDISADAAAIIPKEMELEFIESKGSAGNAIFSSKAEYLDKQISKGILGQTMSTDDGASLSQAEVHENVRHDIARADARQMAATVNRDFIRPFVDLNFGPQDRYPTLVFPITEAEDVKTLVDAVERLVPLGLRVSMPEVRERIGFENPEEGVEVLTPPTSSPVSEPKKLKDDTARINAPCTQCGEVHDLAQDQRQDERNELDILADDALVDWQQDMDGVVAPLKQLFNTAKNYEQLATGIDDLTAKLDVGPIADRLGKLAMKARGLGDTK